MSPPAAKTIPFGAAIQSFTIGGLNIVLNFDQLEEYQQYNSSHFGETIGRVANRVKDAKVNNLNGKSYQLKANNGPNSLHGGPKGWGKQIWAGPHHETRDGKETTAYTLRSADGDAGYPGTVDVSVAYVESTEVEGGAEKSVLSFEYEAKLADDSPDVKETAVNITNHSYFNLSGDPTIEGTEATLGTNVYLPLDDTGIPTTGPTPHETIPASKPFTIGSKEPDLDDCFILNPHPATIPLDSRKSPLKLAGAFTHPSTNIHLEVHTTEPAFQFYTGKYIDVPAVGSAPKRVSRAGFCVEPSRYVNAINVDDWRHTVLLKRGEVYGSRIVYKGWKA